MPVDTNQLRIMNTVRSIVSAAHEQRAAASRKVRQPLARVTVRVNLSPVLKKIIADEVNVKEVRIDVQSEREVVLDTALTPELIAEGFVREYIRAVQNLRKEMKLSMTEKISTVYTDIPDEQKEYLKQHEEWIKQNTRTERIIFGSIEDGQSVTVSTIPVTLKLERKPERIFR